MQWRQISFINSKYSYFEAINVKSVSFLQMLDELLEKQNLF